jgi:uncharacterized short protein YbdD (DUF466 family)
LGGRGGGSPPPHPHPPFSVEEKVFREVKQNRYGSTFQGGA